MNVFTAGGKGLWRCQGTSAEQPPSSIPSDAATGKGCWSPPAAGPSGGSQGCLLAEGAAWHKEGDTTVVSQIALELQVLLGVAPLNPSDGASSHAQESLPGSPSTPTVSCT